MTITNFSFKLRGVLNCCDVLKKVNLINLEYDIFVYDQSNLLIID